MPIAPKGFKRTWGEQPYVGRILKEFHERVLNAPELRNSPTAALLRQITPGLEQEVPYGATPATVKVSPEWGPAFSRIKEMTSRALNAMPRPIKEKLTKSKDLYYVRPIEGRSIYDPTTGQVHIGTKSGTGEGLAANVVDERTQSKLSHELKHAADFGIDKGAYAAYGKHRKAGDVLGEYERGRVRDTLVNWGYEPAQVGTEVRALGHESVTGPIYRRGEGRNIIAREEPERWAVGGVQGINPLDLSESARKALVGVSRREADLIRKGLIE